MVPASCLVCSAACGSGASGEHRYAEVWGVRIPAKHHYYLRISSIQVTAPFDFTPAIHSLGEDAPPILDHTLYNLTQFGRQAL